MLRKYQKKRDLILWVILDVFLKKDTKLLQVIIVFEKKQKNIDAYFKLLNDFISFMYVCVRVFVVFWVVLHQK